jgi:hypothetical protein
MLLHASLAPLQQGAREEWGMSQRTRRFRIEPDASAAKARQVAAVPC